MPIKLHHKIVNINNNIFNLNNKVDRDDALQTFSYPKKSPEETELRNSHQ
jgi:hypothetical protein